MPCADHIRNTSDRESHGNCAASGEKLRHCFLLFWNIAPLIYAWTHATSRRNQKPLTCMEKNWACSHRKKNPQEHAIDLQHGVLIYWVSRSKEHIPLIYTSSGRPALIPAARGQSSADPRPVAAISGPREKEAPASGWQASEERRLTPQQPPPVKIPFLWPFSSIFYWLYQIHRREVDAPATSSVPHTSLLPTKSRDSGLLYVGARSAPRCRNAPSN